MKLYLAGLQGLANSTSSWMSAVAFLFLVMNKVIIKATILSTSYFSEMVLSYLSGFVNIVLITSCKVGIIFNNLPLRRQLNLLKDGAQLAKVTDLGSGKVIQTPKTVQF